MVEGVGMVLSGIVKSGVATINAHCLLGPDKVKNFKQVVIKSIHVNRTNREKAHSGELACLCVKPVKANEKINRKEIHRGMVVVETKEKLVPTRVFEAELQVLHNHTTIKEKYEGVMHCGTIQQTVTIQEIYNEEKLLRNEDRGLAKFEFKYQPEYIREGETVLLREGKTKILGTITKIIS